MFGLLLVTRRTAPLLTTKTIFDPFTGTICHAAAPGKRPAGSKPWKLASDSTA